MSDWNNIRWSLRYHWKAGLIWGLSIGVACIFPLCSPTEKAEAWVKGTQPFPEGEAAVVLHRFCQSRDCGPLAAWEWDELIQQALDKWNNAGSKFRFLTRPPRPTDDPCNLPEEVAVIFSNEGSLCPGDGFGNYGEIGGRTVYGSGNRVRVYIRVDSPSAEFARRLALPYLIHEFGHVVGLGHPDEAGQEVSSIMNSSVIDLTLEDPFWPELRSDDIQGIWALYGKDFAVGTLENPTPVDIYGKGSSHQSGVGIISGWVCEAEKVEIVILDIAKEQNEEGYITRHEPGYGTERLDTKKVCGDTDNGFGLLFNWNRLGDGEYIVNLIVHGFGPQGLVSLGHARVKVTTLGEEFLRGAEGEYVLENFPEAGQSVTIEWNQGLQNFVITGRE